MKTDLTRLMNEILAWPAGDQAELAAYAQKIRARRARPFAIPDAGARNGPRHAVRSRAAADRQIETFWQRRGG
ncbi:MAG: hypothetical protein IT535_07025 [Bauldia sp.]|nr:hypothetical protein [Bauldia sp.]